MKYINIAKVFEKQNMNSRCPGLNTLPTQFQTRNQSVHLKIKSVFKTLKTQGENMWISGLMELLMSILTSIVVICLNPLT